MNNDKFMGIDKSTMHHQLNNNLVWNGEDRDNVMFTSNREDVFDFLTYTILIYNCSPWANIIYISIPQLARIMGYVPKSGKGKINDKIKQSLDRLRNNLFIEYKIVDKSYIIKVHVKNVCEHFFQLHYSTINKIIGLDTLIEDENGEVIDDTNKYLDKAKALYVYCYIVARMGYIDDESKISCCYPSYEEICEDCSIDKTTLTKLLRYFEMDDLLYTVNIGQVSKDGLFQNSNNYYTTSLDNISSIAKYSKTYYEAQGYKVKSRETQFNTLAREINKILVNTFRELNIRDRDNANNSEYVQLKPIYVKMIDFTFKSFLGELKVDYEGFKNWMNSKSYLDSKYKNAVKAKNMMFLLDLPCMNIEFLNHVKNVLEGVTYLFKLK